MSKLTDIKQKISQMDGGRFQELCDAYLSKLGYRNIFSLGMSPGTHKTTKGIPDTYFPTNDGNYIFVMYTTQITGNVFNKIFDDIKTCFDEEKTELSNANISEIIYCHTFSNITAGQDKKLRTYCEGRGVSFSIYGIDTIAQDLYDKYHVLARDLLSIKISTGQILSDDEFMRDYNSNTLAATLDTEFQFREKEVESILNAINEKCVIIICGQAGVGKTRIALEVARRYHSLNKGRYFCIRSNRLHIHEDLHIYLDTPGKYLLLIDDANQVTGLEHILKYINKTGYNVKIIITVREYAKSSVIRDVREVVYPHIEQINIFTDEEIKDLVKNCFEILNHRYLEKIIRIAEGNARMAILAGKIASETNRLESIDDASQLYDDYYGRYLRDNDILKINKKLCATAGIVAFLDALHLEHLDALVPLFSHVQMSVDEFEENVRLLHDLEIVDICNDKAVRFSEQCLSNYLMKYVYIDLEILPLKLAINTLFSINKNRVIGAVNTLLYVFRTKEVHDSVLKSILDVWNGYRKSNDANFNSFLKAFYQANPVETLIILKNRVETEERVYFDINLIDFEKEKRKHHSENDIIEILCGFALMRELPEALELLFIYLQKRPDLFMEFFSKISGAMGISKDSEDYGYYTQIELIKKFQEHSNEWNDHIVCSLFLRISKKLLQLVHRPSEGGRKNTFVMYTIPIRFTEGAKEYRELIWTALLLLSKNSLYSNQVKSVVEDYGQAYKDDIDIEVTKFDLTFVLKLFSSSYSPDNLNDCIAVDGFYENMKRLGVEDVVELDDFLCTRHLSIYKLLSNNGEYGAEEETKKKAIAKYLKKAELLDIKELFDLCACIRVNDNDDYLLRNGLAIVFKHLENDRDLYFHSVDYYLSLDTPLSVYPDLIVKKLFDYLSDVDVYTLLTKYNYAEKNTWVYFFYYHLPKEYINEQYVNDLYEFFAMREDMLDRIYSRKLDFLDRYSEINDDVFIKCCEIILSKVEYAPHMVYLYCDDLFNSYSGSHIDTINKFSRNYPLLAEIYIATLQSDSHTDYDGSFISAFLPEYPPILVEYMRNIVTEEQQSKRYHEHRLMALWKLDNYIELFDLAVEIVHEITGEDCLYSAPYYLYDLLANDGKDCDIVKNQDEWLLHYINLHFNDDKRMYVIFESIAKFPPARRVSHIVHFTEINPDFDAFKKISLEESSWGGTGSQIPYMEARIEFLESLLPYYAGIKYLKHKQKIMKDIEMWQYRIKEKQIDEMLRW